MILVGSKTYGGTGHMSRILKVAAKGQHVQVLVKAGEHQDKVYSYILRDMANLHATCKVGFTYEIRKA